MLALQEKKNKYSFKLNFSFLNVGLEHTTDSYKNEQLDCICSFLSFKVCTYVDGAYN